MATDPPAVERLPPFNVEAEESVVASLLVDEEAFTSIAGILEPGDFYREQNKWAYEACLAVREQGTEANQVTVAHELATRDRLEAVGGAAFLSKLVTDLPTPIGVEHYARIVKRCAVYQRLITEAGQMVKAAYSQNGDIGTVLDTAQQRLDAVREMAVLVLGKGEPLAFLEGEELMVPMGESPHVIDELMPLGGVTILAADAETYKSWFLVEMLQCIAAGIAVLGRFRVRQGPTWYFDQQDGEFESRRRCLKLAAAGQRNLATIPFRLTADADLNLDNPADLAMIRDAALAHGVIAIGFNALSDVFPGRDLDRTQDGKLAMKVLVNFSHSTGIGVSAIHHLRKKQQKGINEPEARLLGSVHIRNDCDSYLHLLLNGPKAFILQHAKARRGPRMDPISVAVEGAIDDPYVRLRYVQGEGEPADLQREVVSKAVQLVAQRGPMRKPDIADVARDEGWCGLRTLESALNYAHGAQMLEKGKPPGKGGGAMWYWDETQPPAWAATEEMAFE